MKVTKEEPPDKLVHGHRGRPMSPLMAAFLEAKHGEWVCAELETQNQVRSARSVVMGVVIPRSFASWSDHRM